jgi:hypothetical protein
MKKELINLFLFIGVCFLFYLIFRNFNGYKEGLETSTTEESTAAKGTPPINGIAGNAASYGATIKAQNIKFQDQFLISKYRSDYETIVLDLDELVDNLMLKTALMPTKNPEETFTKLAGLNQAKGSLNNIMKYIDKK